MRLICSLLFTFPACISQIPLLLSVAGCQIPLQGPKPNESDVVPILDANFAAWIEEIGRGWGMKGVAIAVVRKDTEGERWTTETKGYGVADRWGNPVDEESLFSIASNSKLFTAVAVGMLVSNESIPIEWDSKIKDILPGSIWTLQDKVAEESANLVDILSHRTGLPRHDLSQSSWETVESSLEKLKYLRPSAEFREVWQYNNKMYTLASHIVSRLTDNPFIPYVMHNIIRPLGLSSTTYSVAEANQSGKLTDSFVNVGKNEPKGEHMDFWPIPFIHRESDKEINAGDGGIITNAKDMATWLQALLLSGRSPATGEAIIPASVVEKLAKGVMVENPVPTFPEFSPRVYGMAQVRYTYQGHELIEHDGAIYGQHSVLVRFPHDGLAIAVLTNWDYGAVLKQIIKWKIVDKVFNLKEVDWNQRYHSLANNDVHESPPLANTSPPPVPYHELAGIYYNPAYGTLKFCVYPPPKHPSTYQNGCDELMSDPRSPLHSHLNDSMTILLASWPRIEFAHVLLRHFSGVYFNASGVASFPAPFPEAPGSDAKSRPFAVGIGGCQANFALRNGASEFVEKVEGLALKGAWGAGEGIESPKGDGREGAEVWFDRVT